MAAQSQSLDDIARKLLSATVAATAGSQNETSLRHELENALEKACGEMGVAWSPFRLDLTLQTSDPRRKRYVDVAHGAVIIEYEPPQSLSGSEKATAHAKAQAEEYARLLSAEEGRSVSDYQLVIWDGSHIAFGEVQNGGTSWSSLTSFGMAGAKRLLGALRRDGVPLVHPLLLAHMAGPDSPLGTELIPKLFRAVLAAEQSRQTSKTKLLFFEWRRLFGQVVGIQTDSLKQLLVRQSEVHREDYGTNVAAYLFALNTFIALVAKLVAAMALKGAAEDIRDNASPIRERLQVLESGELFANAGVANMLNGDFFAWYLDDNSWRGLTSGVESLIAGLSNINFDVSKKSPDSTRDLFKGLYQSFVPRALRHALGEFYTPGLAGGAYDERSGLATPRQSDRPDLRHGNIFVGRFATASHSRARIGHGGRTSCGAARDGLEPVGRACRASITRGFFIATAQAGTRTSPADLSRRRN